MRAAALRGVPLAALAALASCAVVYCRVGFAVVCCRIGFAVALIGSLRCTRCFRRLRRRLLSLRLRRRSHRLAVARFARVRAAALRGVPLATLAAFVGCAVVGRRIGIVVALVGDRRASLRSRACRRYLRGVPLVGSLLSLRSSALRRRRFGFTVVLVGCRRCSLARVSPCFAAVRIQP